MDTIADFLTAIRNGYLAKRETISVNVSKTRLEIVKILKEAGFVSDFTVIEEKPVSKLTVTLRYFEKDLPAIAGIKRVSKPSVRIHKAYNEIPLTLSGAGLTIVSTSKGLMAGKQASKNHLGGEIICQVW